MIPSFVVAAVVVAVAVAVAVVNVVVVAAFAVHVEHNTQATTIEVREYVTMSLEYSVKI